MTVLPVTIFCLKTEGLQRLVPAKLVKSDLWRIEELRIVNQLRTLFIKKKKK
jgi:hypothetical protein